MIKEAVDPTAPTILKDRLIWIMPSERYDQGNARVMQLDKRTLAVTRLGVIPGKYARQVMIDERYLWCFPEDYYRWEAEGREPEVVVYSSRTCRRVRLAEAGPAPDPKDRMPLMMRLPHPQDVRLLAADHRCVWLQHVATSRIYELPDDGPPRTIDLAGISARSFLRSRWSLPEGCLCYPDSGSARLLLIKAGAPTATLLAFPDSIRDITVGDRRLWFFGHDKKWYIAGTDWRFRAGTLPPSANNPDTISLAKGDALYFFGENGPQQLDGVTGQISEIASWATQLSEEERAKLKHPDLSYRAPDGRLMFLFRERDNDNARQSVAVSYDPAQDRWQCRRVDHPYFTSMVVTPTATYYLSFDDPGVIYRCEGDGPTPAGRLPFADITYSMCATERYLYLGTAVGVYRAPWAELLRR